MTDFFNRTESAKWAIESQKAIEELQGGREKALAEAAARGFPAAPGATLAVILSAGQAVKDKLTEANGKIYDDRRKVLFEQDEFTMKLIVQISKLAMELYRDELMNALALEAAEKDALRDQGNADVIRLNAEVDKRQVAIIQARAEMERRITVLKAQLVVAEEGTLVFETALINAQLATATKKLEIIDSIYQVLEAEELVLVSENRRIAILEDVLITKEAVAAIKKEMVPYYLQKADAEEDLAVAIGKDALIREEIENLGFDRLDLKAAQNDFEHQERVFTEELERDKLALTRVESVIKIARENSRRVLLEIANKNQMGDMAGDDNFPGIQAIRQGGALLSNQEHEIARIYDELIKDASAKGIRTGYEADYIEKQSDNLTFELSNILINLSNQAIDKAQTVEASATQSSKSDTTHLLQRKIIAGLIVG